MYTPRPEDAKRIKNDFQYHKPHSDNQTDRYGVVRGMLHDAAHRLLTLCPPSRELSLALTKLEEAMFWANASIARNEKSPEGA